MAGGANNGGDFLKQFQQAKPGIAAPNPQATPAATPQAGALPPWMGQMGAQMMQAGMQPQRPMPAPMPHPQMQPGPGQMNMPPPTMQQQPTQQMTVPQMNQLLARRIGLMGPLP